MDTIERRFMSLKKVSWYWNIPFTSLLDHLVGKIVSRKCDPLGVLLVDEEAKLLNGYLACRIAFC
jgi:hypothetical protein